MSWRDVDGHGTFDLGEDGLRAIAPEAFAAFDHMVAGVAGVPHPDLIELTRLRVGQVLGPIAGADAETPGGPEADVDVAAEKVRALASWSISPMFTTVERTGLGFAEQFVVDVGAIDEEQRAALKEALGADTFEYVQALYVLDHGLRLAAALRQLFGVELTGPRSASAGDDAGAGMWPLVDSFLTSVARLSGLDALTTELVRLRGARAHQCRLCQSRRSLSAVSTDGGETALDLVDVYETSDLSERHKVALRLTDAIVWQPTAYPEGLADQVRAQFGPAEALEIVLDVARNASNKSAVALGVDQPNVTEGVEYFDMDADGNLVDGLTR